MTAESRDLDSYRLRDAIQILYMRMVMEPQSTFHFHRGPQYATAVLGYSTAALALLPEEVTAALSGIGNPLRVAAPKNGMAIVGVNAFARKS